MRIAMIGTRGVPAHYGGFETAVQEVGQRLAARHHQVTVYCRGRRHPTRRFLGMDLINLPHIHHRAFETLSHTALSALHASAWRPQVVLLFNAANAPFVPLLRTAGIPVAIHLDGLEWRRQKWAGIGARYYLWAEASSVRRADSVIADARSIAAYVYSKYGVDSTYIPYGAPRVQGPLDRLRYLGLAPRGYHLVVARFEPENHVHLIVDGYTRSAAVLPLVVVGSASYSQAYEREVRRLAERRSGEVRFLGGVWDQALLDQLYQGSASYVHGHSVGGTNPSLLRAMGAGALVIAYDVAFNREVSGGHALFFDDALSVSRQLERADSPQPLRALAETGRSHVLEHYNWDRVTDAYERLCSDMLRRALRQRL